MMDGREVMEDDDICICLGICGSVKADGGAGALEGVVMGDDMPKSLGRVRAGRFNWDITSAGIWVSNPGFITDTLPVPILIGLTPRIGAMVLGGWM